MTSDSEGKKKREVVSIELRPDLKAMLQQILDAEPDTDVSKIFRRSLRFFMNEGPQATSAEELWVLSSLRKLKRQNPGMWAQLLRTFASVMRGFGVQMPKQMAEDLADIANSQIPHPEMPKFKRRKPAG